MGIDHDACNTCLVLGLGVSSKAKKPTSTAVPSTSFEPFLTLSLSGESYQKVHEEPPTSAGELYRQGSPPSAVSSFSSGRIKRERDLSSEEVEVEKNSCRISDEDEDEDAVNARKKLRLTKEQSAFLEDSFKQHRTLNPSQKQALARQLDLKPRQVEVWFQNRRARTKLKQTEVDCEFLKKCCETLTNENRRLQKELQELKALKITVAQPFYMPAVSTLTMCPSCERIGDGGGRDGNSKNPFSMPSKSRFYNSVTNPSAAC